MRIKKIIGTILIILLTSFISIPVYANPANTVAGTYTLSEVGITVDVPSGFYVITRDISPSSLYFDYLNLSYDDLMANFKTNNIYLDAIDQNVNYEIIITMVDGESIKDFNLFNDETILALTDGLRSEYAKIGKTILEANVFFQHKQAKFLKIYSKDSSTGSNVYYLQYYTIYNNKAINVTLNSFNGEPDSKQLAYQMMMVNSIVFDTEPQTSETIVSSEAFEYLDRETGTIFTVPANWSKVDFNDDRQFLEAKFRSSLDSTVIMMYGSVDFWSMMSDQEKVGMKRSDVNNSYISANDIAEIFGSSASDVRTATYNGKNYYFYTIPVTAEYAGLDLGLYLTCAVHIDNGYVYQFQFSGKPGDYYYSDFESLLSTVEYNSPVTEQQTTTSNNTSVAPADNDTTPKISSSSSKINSSLIAVLIGVAIALIIQLLPMIIYRFAIVGEPVSADKAKRICFINAIVSVIVGIVISFVLFTAKNGLIHFAVALLSIIGIGLLCYNILSRRNDSSVKIEPQMVSETFTETQYDHENNNITESAEKIDEIISEPESNEIENIERMFCRKCGKPIPGDSEYCNYCGNKVIRL